VHVAGKWPTGGYAQPVSMMRVNGLTAYVDLYWSKPQGPVTYAVEPFTYEAPLKLALPGTYMLRARIYLDGQLVDWDDLSVEVTQGTGSGWPWGLSGLSLGLL
jgi:hypothetical protein